MWAGEFEEGVSVIDDGCKGRQGLLAGVRVMLGLNWLSALCQMSKY